MSWNEMMNRQEKLDKGLVNEPVYQRHWGRLIAHALVALGFVSAPEISKQLVPETVWRLLPEKLIRYRRVLPLQLQSSRGPLLVAMSDPLNLTLLDEISFAAGIPVEPALASERDIEHAIARHLDQENKQIGS